MCRQKEKKPFQLVLSSVGSSQSDVANPTGISRRVQMNIVALYNRRHQKFYVKSNLPVTKAYQFTKSTSESLLNSCTNAVRLDFSHVEHFLLAQEPSRPTDSYLKGHIEIPQPTKPLTFLLCFAPSLHSPFVTQPIANAQPRLLIGPISLFLYLGQKA